MGELQFAFDEASTHEEEGPDCAPGEDGLMRVHLAYLLRPYCAYQQQVLHVAHLAREQLAAGRSPAQPCDPAALAGLLADCGCTVTLREAVRGCGSRRRGCPIFTRLPHRFIVVAGRSPASCPTAACGDGSSSSACSELLVDPAFCSHFEVARATPRYRALLALLPRLFVGPAWQLRELVDWLSSEMAWSFQALGESLPPWRRKESLLSKWLPEQAADTPIHSSMTTRVGALHYDRSAAAKPHPTASPRCGFRPEGGSLHDQVGLQQVAATFARAQPQVKGTSLPSSSERSPLASAGSSCSPVSVLRGGQAAAAVGGRVAVGFGPTVAGPGSGTAGLQATASWAAAARPSQLSKQLTRAANERAARRRVVHVPPLDHADEFSAAGTTHFWQVQQ